jgi:hypothetical protein
MTLTAQIDPDGLPENPAAFAVENKKSVLARNQGPVQALLQRPLPFVDAQTPQIKNQIRRKQGLAFGPFSFSRNGGWG